MGAGIGRWGAVLLIAAGALLAAVLLWLLPYWQTAALSATLTPQAVLLVQNQLRQTLVLLLGVMAVAGAVGVLWRRAAPQLADDTLETRLGAIYALEQVALESAAQHRAVVEVLCAFVRSRASVVAQRPPGAPLAIDVQAVLTVLGRRNRTHQPGERLDLRRTDLRGADLNGARLGAALLSGAHLEGASLQSADLDGADLRGARLGSADLVEARLAHADLREAQMESAYLVEAHMEGADLGGAHLSGAYLGGAHLEGANLTGANLEGAYMYKAHLEGTTLPEDTPLQEPERASRATSVVSLRRRRVRSHR